MNTSATQSLTPAHHLTPDQFAECVLNDAPSPECREHLAHCAQCNQELALFQSSVGSFTSASLSWSESRPATSLRAAARSSRPSPFLAPVGWALATAALIVAGLPLLHHQTSSPPAYTQAQAVSPIEDTEAEIAQDNHLLQSVDSALAQVDPSPLNEYNLTDAGLSRPQTHQAQRIR